MKTHIKALIIVFLTTTSGCQKNSESGSVSADTQGLIGGGIYGKWVYEFPTSTSTKAKGIAANVKSNGEIEILNVFAVLNGSSATMVFRKSVGTYTMSGEVMSLNYSYETCNPVGKEQLIVRLDPSNGDRLLVSTLDKSVFFTMSRLGASKSDYSITAVEDKNCNLISKIIKEGRKPASTNSVLTFSNF